MCKKEYKAQESTMTMPGIRSVVGKTAVEIPGESVRARVKGKKAEAIETHKESIRKQREARLKAIEQEGKEQAERDRLLQVGFAMMRDER